MFDQIFSRNGFSHDRLRCLVEVHDAGSIAAAVGSDHVRQSQYSRQLRELSEFFGCELTTRKGKVLKLTPQGLELARIARRQFTELQDFLSTCSDGGSEYAIAAGDSIIQWLVIPRLGALYEKFPGVRWTTLNLRTKDIVQQVEDGRVHFGLVRSDVRHPALDLAPLGRLQYAAVIPKKLAPVEPTPLLEDVLQSIPFGGLSSDGKFGGGVREVFSKLGCVYRPQLECESFPQLLQAVGAGTVAAFIPKIALENLQQGDLWIIEDSALNILDRDIALLWSPRLEEIRPLAQKIRKAAESIFSFSS